jgi:hypothetical protein
MLIQMYDAHCHDCKQELLSACLQYDQFECTRCGRQVVLCHTCREDRTCRYCKKGKLESAYESTRRIYPNGNFMF